MAMHGQLSELSLQEHAEYGRTTVRPLSCSAALRLRVADIDPNLHSYLVVLRLHAHCQEMHGRTAAVLVLRHVGAGVCGQLNEDAKRSQGLILLTTWRLSSVPARLICQQLVSA
jgi:hypothetical protein